MTSRLQFVKQLFLKLFGRINWKKWNGDTSIFDNYKNALNDYHNNWKAAENLNLFTDLYDMMGVFQNVLNLLHSIMQKQLEQDMRESIYNDIHLFLEKYKKRLDVLTAEEMGKIEFSKETGFNLFNINPNNCDISVARSMLMDIISEVINIIKSVLGPQAAIKYLRQVNNVAFITGGDRSDLALVALNEKVSCLILTGFLEPDTSVITKATEQNIPVILSPSDTYTTLRNIERIRPSIKRGELDIISEAIQKKLDWDLLLK